MHFMSSNLLMVFLYVWSRFYPDEAYNILGVIEFKGIYLPYAFAIISLLFEPNHWKNDVLGNFKWIFLHFNKVLLLVILIFIFILFFHNYLMVLIFLKLLLHCN